MNFQNRKVCLYKTVCKNHSKSFSDFYNCGNLLIKEGIGTTYCANYKIETPERKIIPNYELPE